MMENIYKQDYVDLVKSKIYIRTGQRCPICGGEIVAPNFPEINENEHICLNANCEYFYNDIISYEDIKNLCQ